MKLVRKDIRQKVEKGTPLTKKQKLEVLKNARDLLSTNFGKHSWSMTINGIEHYCLYGAVQQVCGLDPDEANDRFINSCSITSQMFDALPARNKNRLLALKSIERLRERGYHTENEMLDKEMAYKVRALQNVNDQQGKVAVLRVLDKAIKKLEE